jgi:hypothetical protein
MASVPFCRVPESDLTGEIVGVFTRNPLKGKVGPMPLSVTINLPNNSAPPVEVPTAFTASGTYQATGAAAPTMRVYVSGCQGDVDGVVKPYPLPVTVGNNTAPWSATLSGLAPNDHASLHAEITQGAFQASCKSIHTHA